MKWRPAVGWRLATLLIIAGSYFRTGSNGLLFVTAPLASQLAVVMLLRWKWRPADVLTPAQRLNTAMAGLVSHAAPMTTGLTIWWLLDVPYNRYGRALLFLSGLVLMGGLAGGNTATWRLLRLTHDLDPVNRRRHKHVVSAVWLASSILFTIAVAASTTVPRWIMFFMIPLMVGAGLLTVRFWDTSIPPPDQKAAAQSVDATRRVDQAVWTYLRLFVLAMLVLTATMLFQSPLAGV